MSDIHPFIRQLIALRKAQHLTQTTVAAAIGVSKTTICEMEKGHHEPKLATFVGYAQAVGWQWPQEPAPDATHRLGRHRPENIYQVTAEHPDGRYMGHACDPADAARIVEALNRMEAP